MEADEAPDESPAPQKLTMSQSLEKCLIPSIFPNGQTVIGFCDSPTQRVSSVFPSAIPMKASLRKRLFFKTTALNPKVAKQTMRRSGFRATEGDDWTMMWGKHLKNEEYRDVQPWQRVNHFCGSFNLGRKDSLLRNINRAARRHASDYAFFPKSFFLPEQMDEFLATKGPWILKPPAGARGNGISVISSPAELPKKPCIAQKYVRDPHLINGRKYDMRLYVLVSSVDPLKIYLFQDGLVRFATVPYQRSSKSLGDRLMHLTNYSLQKSAEGFVENEDDEEEEEDDESCKWSILQLKRFYRDNGIDDTEFWTQVENIIVKTVMAVQPQIFTLTSMYCPALESCYEVFGFDILPDKNLKPWLLEVNVSPSLHSTSPLDIRIKSSLAADTFNLVGIPPPDFKAIQREQAEAMQARLMGKAKGIAAEKSAIFAKHALEIDPIRQIDTQAAHILRTFEDEIARIGRYTLLFPTRERCEKEFGRFLENASYANRLLWRFVSCEEQERERVLQELREV